MVKDLHELAEMLSKRDNISLLEAEKAIAMCQMDMESAFYNGNLDLAEQIMMGDLDLDTEYFSLFIN